MTLSKLVADDTHEVSMGSIRSQWQELSGSPESEPPGGSSGLEQELEKYLNATTFSVLLKIDKVAAELGSSVPIDVKLEMIHTIKRQVKLCSDIGLLSIRRQANQ